MPGVANPLLLDFPDQFESERLILRAPRAGDGTAGNAAIRESLDELRPWTPWATPVPTVEDTEANYRRGAARWITRESLPLVLFRKEDGLFVGGSGLHSIDWSVPVMEIGYWLRTRFVGQGYMTEAVRAITAFAFEQLGAARIEIRMDSRNTRSAAVAERAGYTREACLKHEARGVDGSLRDTLLYAMIAPD